MILLYESYGKAAAFLEETFVRYCNLVFVFSSFTYSYKKANLLFFLKIIFKYCMLVVILWKSANDMVLSNLGSALSSSVSGGNLFARLGLNALSLLT